MTDLETFIHDNDDRIFRVYKKNPQDLTKYVSLGDYYFTNAIELPDRDVLVEMHGVHADYMEEDGLIKSHLVHCGSYIEYYRLSDIEFADVTETEDYLGLK